jgi:LysR family transcriptional regulator, nitrogen assimilation regulatory protein
VQIRQLEYFMHVAETLNITHAANRAHVTQPALSRSIRLLEQELGTSLFARKARGVELTASGNRLATQLRGLLKNIDQMRNDMISAADEPVGTLRFAVSNSLCHILTAPAIRQFCALFPAVSIHVREGTSLRVRELLVNNEADLAIFSEHGSFAGLSPTNLCGESLVLIGPPNAGLQISRPVPVSDLARLDLILTAIPNGLRRTVDEMIHETNDSLDPRIVADTNSLMLALIRDGTGHTVLPYSGVHDALQSGQVSAAPIIDRRWQWVAAVSRDRAVSAAAARMLEIILDLVKSRIRNGDWLTADLGG